MPSDTPTASCAYRWQYDLDAGGACPNAVSPGSPFCLVHQENGDLPLPDGFPAPGLSLREGHFHGKNLAGCNFSRADLRGADFRGADLSQADFRGANLLDTRFDEADVHQTIFYGAVFHTGHLQAARNPLEARLSAPRPHGPHNLPHGTILDERWIILDKLGQGSFGFVYKARQVFGTTPAAIKILNPQWYADPKTLKRFLRQKELLEKLDHPALVRILEMGYGDGLHFLVMEFLDGMTLKEWMEARDGKPPETDEGVRIAVQIAQGLKALAGHRVLHRDIKPTNIFLQPDGSVKLLDYELAKYLDYSTLSTSQTPGTPRYWSPEHSDPEAFSEAGDVYSYGLVMHELFTGQFPRSSKDSGKPYLWQSTEEAPLSPDKIQPDLPAGIVSLIIKCLAKTKEKRYAHFEEVLGAWKEVERGRTAALHRKAAPKPKAPEDMILVPGGPFYIGTSEEEAALLEQFFHCSKDLFRDEIPKKEVITKPFYIDRYPVTNETYRRYLRSTGRHPPRHWPNRDYAPEKDHDPVRGVSFWDALNFARWMDKDLPTEAEWEKAARGTGNFIWPWGNTYKAGFANCNGEYGGTISVQTMPDGASPYGVMHMAGNVWEWTRTPSRLLQEYRIAKGGCWLDTPAEIRCAARFDLIPSISPDFVGFRCIRYTQ